ncbi:MAG: ATP-binding protein [Bacteroidetes bacterium]|nr:MAG: ATP-binding protein [Bacteroidota bacterium]
MKSYLRVRCSKEYLATIRDFVRDRLDEMKIEDVASHQIVLAVDECCANCMIHQHQCDGYSTLEITVYRQGDKVYTEVRDNMPAFPLDSYQPREIDQIVKDRAKGGLGINLIRKIMDEVKVEEQKGYYAYVLIKKIEPEGPSQTALAAG